MYYIKTLVSTVPNNENNQSAASLPQPKKKKRVPKIRAGRKASQKRIKSVCTEWKRERGEPREEVPEGGEAMVDGGGFFEESCDDVLKSSF